MSAAVTILTRACMPLTISQRLAGPCLLLLLFAPSAFAQPPAEAQAADAFARHRWRFETGLHGAFETWNYNGSHEELYGLAEGLTYGVRDGLLLTMSQRIYYVSQRANDSWLLGLTFGFRRRLYHRGRVASFVEGDVGVSDAAIAAPPRGTRFNYLAMGSGGLLVRLAPRVHAIAAIQWIHVSNNSLKGPGRNPDTEAVGPHLGVSIGF
jgi:hypothetical protein